MTKEEKIDLFAILILCEEHFANLSTSTGALLQVSRTNAAAYIRVSKMLAKARWSLEEEFGMKDTDSLLKS